MWVQWAGSAGGAEGLMFVVQGLRLEVGAASLCTETPYRQSDDDVAFSRRTLRHCRVRCAS